MLISDRFHVSYCTNIHPGENWEVTFAHLKANLPKVKQRIAPDTDFGLGLRLSNRASEELEQGTRLQEFKQWLLDEGCYVYTMNGFPYGNFHNERVKDSVHQPDWTTKSRVRYTQRLFEQLAHVLPEGLNGSISTSPISYKHWFETPEAKEAAMRSGADNMLEVAVQLYRTEQESGPYLNLAIEPEPDGILENTAEVIAFFKDYLVPQGQERFGKEYGFDPEKAAYLVKRYISVCYDVCHFSLAYEAPERTFKAFKEQGINIGKIQVSSALKIRLDGDVDGIWKALSAFDEPTYLHQVTEKRDGEVFTYADLPEVLGKSDIGKELRAHFHVPIFLEDFGMLGATQDQILETLDCLKDSDICDHLEVETYTWDVLPDSLKFDLVDSIVRELDWLIKKL
ncbi:MAG: metabolite traffic protein EboE [Flavobacteriaceae bacterium]|nr:metabolite traffic protein EboE [Flavobacteriaceae bacterium]